MLFASEARVGRETSETGTSASQESTGGRETVIRKYANRRLYNTATAKFVTLQDLHDMVKRGEAFVVEDAKTGRDITCSVLAQIISEEETKGHNMLPLNYLRQVLQAYDAGLGPQFRLYIERSMEAFIANQKQISEQMQNMFAIESSDSAMKQLAEMGRQNVEMFQRSMRLFTPPAEAWGGAADDSPVARGDDQEQRQEDEIEGLRQQLADIADRLDTLSRTK